MPQNKTGVVSCLDSNGAALARYVYVIVDHGALEQLFLHRRNDTLISTASACLKQKRTILCKDAAHPNTLLPPKTSSSQFVTSALLETTTTRSRTWAALSMSTPELLVHSKCKIAGGKKGNYGCQIHDALSGSMHNYVLNLRIDFDILGTNNTMTTTKNVAVLEVYPWSND